MHSGREKFWGAKKEEGKEKNLKERKTRASLLHNEIRTFEAFRPHASKATKKMDEDTKFLPFFQFL